MPWNKNESAPNCLSWLQKGGGGDRRRKQIYRSPEVNDASRPSIVATLGYHPRNLQEPLSPRGNPDRVLGFKTFSLEQSEKPVEVPQSAPRDALGPESAALPPQVISEAKAVSPTRLHFGPPLPSSVQPSPRGAFKEKPLRSPRSPQPRQTDRVEDVKSALPRQAEQLENVSVNDNTILEAVRSPATEFDAECIQDVPMEAVRPVPSEQPPGNSIKMKMALFETLMSAASVIREQPETKEESEQTSKSAEVAAAGVIGSCDTHVVSESRTGDQPQQPSREISEPELCLDLQEFDSSDDESHMPFPDEPEQRPVQNPRTNPSYPAIRHSARSIPDHNTTAWVSELLEDDPTVVVTLPSRRGPSTAHDVRVFSKDVAFRQTTPAEPVPLANLDSIDAQRLRLSSAQAAPCFRFRSNSAIPKDYKAVEPEQAFSAAPTPQHMSEKSTNSVPSLPSCLGTPRDQPAQPLASAPHDDRGGYLPPAAARGPPGAPSPALGLGCSGGLRGKSVFRVSELQTESPYYNGSLIQRIELDLQMLDSDDSGLTSALSSPRNFADRERVGLLC